jgi:hypothetical protein
MIYWAIASKMFEQEYNNIEKTNAISNRDTNHVTFDFITKNGFYTVQIKKNDLENNKSIWSKLFEKSKFLNTEMERVQIESQKAAEKRYQSKLSRKNEK